MGSSDTHGQFIFNSIRCDSCIYMEMVNALIYHVKNKVGADINAQNLNSSSLNAKWHRRCSLDTRRLEYLQINCLLFPLEQMFTFRDEHVPTVLNVQYMLPICSAHDLEAPEFIHFRSCDCSYPCWYHLACTWSGSKPDTKWLMSPTNRLLDSSKPVKT